FLIYTGNVERDGVFILGSPSLWHRPEEIQTIMGICSQDKMIDDPTDPYVLILRPENQLHWFGRRMDMTVREEAIDLKLGHVRLIAGGSDGRLASAKGAFCSCLDSAGMRRLDLVVEQRSNFHKVNNRLTEIRKVAFRLSNTFM